MGRRNLGEVRDESGDPPVGLGWDGRLSGWSETSQGTHL